MLGADITERKLAEQRVQTLNEQLEQRVRELDRVSRALRTLSAGNRAMFLATDEPTLLSIMCEAIVSAGGYDMAIVWYRGDDEGQSLLPMAECGHAPGLAQLQAIKASWADTPDGQGVAALAIRRGEAQVTRDMQADPAYTDWQALLPGRVSAVACPLRVAGQVIGALAIYVTERGLLPPALFIGLAERTGLIRPLTEWMIASVLRLNKAWTEQGCALPIAVNLSARNLRDEDLLDKIRDLQNEWGTVRGLLELEITESSVMDDAAFALRVLHGLRDEGIPLYIDDFGTGYSSLSYSQKLAVEYIKIDQSFVRDMSTSKDSAVIVRSTIDLVRDLGRMTVAEGVETQAHWDQLAAMGCDIVQGYFIARPIPADTFQAWLSQFRPPVTTAV